MSPASVKRKKGKSVAPRSVPSLPATGRVVQPSAAPSEVTVETVAHSPDRPTPDHDRVLLGEIGGPQGLQGELRIRSYTEAPGDIVNYGPLEDATGARHIVFANLRATPKGIIARIDGVTTREAAEALTGTKLYVPRSRLPARKEEEWYHSDLIGLAAFAPDGTPLGTVAAILNFGAGDLIEVTPPAGGASLLVAFTSETVPEVDIEAGRLVLVPPEMVE
jgi:16S rRNA processing protein RimM